jgi:microcystin-dependent protein
MFAGNFAPAAWRFCDGSLLPISESEALFSLIGTTYGGDGQSTFAVPDLRGRLPVHQTAGFVMGQAAGVESVTLTTATTPAHTHAFLASPNNGAQINPSGNVPARFVGNNAYLAAVPNVAMAPDSIGSYGNSQPHDNMQPYLCVSFIISLFGVFPSQS